MLSTADIRDVKFASAMGGYKKEEVEIFLDKIEEDYTEFSKIIAEYEAKAEALRKENEALKASQDSIQTVLLNAQKLADQMIADAKKKSEEILQNAQTNIEVMTAREKELGTAFEIKANERKSSLTKELDNMVKTAQIKADSIKAAAEDSVARQQLLYDRLKMEMSAFKASISAKYKEHLELLKELPDTVPLDPKKMAELVSEAYNKTPAPEQFIQKAEPPQELRSNSEAPKDTPAAEESASGFQVTV